MKTRFRFQAVLCAALAAAAARAEDAARPGPAGTRPEAPGGGQPVEPGPAAKPPPPAATAGQMADGFAEQRREAFRLLGEGRSRESLPLFEAILKRHAKDKATRLGYGTALIETARYGEAQAIYEALMGEFPEEYPIINNLAWLYATAKDPKFRDGKRAAELAQQALLIAPGDYHVWSTLAEAYYVQGEYEKAEKIAREALALSIRFEAEEKLRLEYINQVDRCRRAAQALRILD